MLAKPQKVTCSISTSTISRHGIHFGKVSDNNQLSLEIYRWKNLQYYFLFVFIDLEARIGESAVKTVAQVFSSPRYKRSPLESIAAIERDSERKRFCELIDRLRAVGMQANQQEWMQLVSELALLYADGVDVNELFGDFAQLLERYRHDEATRREIWAAGPFLGLPHHESSRER